MSIVDNLHRIRSRINAINPETELMAVTKSRSVAEIEELYAAGQRLFGENRVQEAESKYPPLKVRFPRLRLHLIGGLQRNKAKTAVKLFDCIQTLDRPSLAERLATVGGAKMPPLFIQVNIGNESQKGGVAPSQAEPLLKRAEGLGLRVEGLMAIPPPAENASSSRSYFVEMEELRRRLGLPRLSMGMSADFEEAIKAGASCVRVGSALFA